MFWACVDGKMQVHKQFNSAVDSDKRSATHTSRFTPGDETPQTHSLWYCRLVSQSGFGVNIMPDPLGYPALVVYLVGISLCCLILLSVEMLVITDAVEESGMQALMGKPERKRATGGPRNKCQNNIKKDISRNMMRTWLDWSGSG